MPAPLLTVLNYSGGRQSACILWMVLLGDIKRPEQFVVLNADPGMENSATYAYNRDMFDLCKAEGIEAITAPGPSLYEDLVTLGTGDKTRIDNPPYWTQAENGKRGRLMQKCTAVYKIAPMDRVLRQLLHERFGISLVTRRPGIGIVEKWIGFAFDEVYRMKPSSQQYINFAYPLIDLKLDRDAVNAYYTANGLPMPPRSVCNACFANGLETLREMHDNRPDDWQQAVRVDRAVRSLVQIGVKEPVFVSNTLLPLEQLAAQNFVLGDEKDQDNYSCDSGYCFT